MNRDTQASILTLLLMLGAALSYDFFYLLPRNGVPVATILFVVLFGPISGLLWSKENLRDCNSKALLKFCLIGVLMGLGLGLLFASRVFINDLTSGQKTELNRYLGSFMIFLVAAGIISIFVGLSFLRLGIKRALGHLFGGTSPNAKSDVADSNSSQLMQDAEHVKEDAFKKFMVGVPDVEPDESDRLPKNYKTKK